MASMQLQNFRSRNKLINLSQEGTLLYEELEGYQKEKAMLQINHNYYNYLLEYIKKDSVLNIFDNTKLKKNHP